jgi:Tfp pilus assembly protein PilV
MLELTREERYMRNKIQIFSWNDLWPLTQESCVSQPPIPNYKSGQTLIEALAAIALMMLIVTALVGVGIRAIHTASVARNKAAAAAYAQEGMEALRSIRDRGFGELTSCSADPSQISWSGSQWTCQAGEESLEELYQRSFALITVSATKVRADVNISWHDQAGDHTTTVTSYFTDWR